MRFSGRKLALIALVAILLGVSMIQLRSRGPYSHTELLPNHQSDTPHSVDTAAAAPARAPGAEALVMIQGLKAQRLVIWPLDGSSEPLEVDRQVTLWPLLPNPDGTYVLYGTKHTVMVLDAVERRAYIVGTLPENGRLIYAQWSPDSRAIAYVVQTPLHLSAYYVLADGSIDAKLMQQVPEGLDLDVAWHTSGKPVLISLGLGPRGGLQTIYAQYDQSTGSLTPLPDGDDLIQTWAPFRSPDGGHQIYATKSWDEARYQGACRTGPLSLAGDEWLPLTLRSTGYERQIAFEIDGLFMDRPIWMDDGRIVFRTVADPICTTLKSGFYVAEIGYEPVKLIEAEPEYIADEAEKLLWTASYALSPDQTHIAWNENAMDAQRSRVYLKPIDSRIDDESDVTLLYETPPIDQDAAFTFQDENMILYFIWLP